ncbi:hypothetical protein NDU88_002466 [Pleurodeles waltl]|uniref:Uncharacterized protein n=1 Tax=Pleurodeles waltl TaxID=8319 RepID=A0AAV7M2J2_PLEWA|nr:hypothetical protein NDU88_002466 [Pleurodeles waltl]
MPPYTLSDSDLIMKIESLFTFARAGSFFPGVANCIKDPFERRAAVYWGRASEGSESIGRLSLGARQASGIQRPSGCPAWSVPLALLSSGRRLGPGGQSTSAPSRSSSRLLEIANPPRPRSCTGRWSHHDPGRCVAPRSHCVLIRVSDPGDVEQQGGGGEDEEERGGEGQPLPRHLNPGPTGHRMSPSSSPRG